MARIITTHYRYKRPPKRQQAVIAQFHLYFDDLFPNSLGKPIVEWW